MYAIIFTGVLISFIYFLHRDNNPKPAFRLFVIMAGKISVMVCLMLGFIFLYNDSFAQSRKNKEKLGLVKVKSPSFKKKKQRQTAAFKGKDFDANTPGGPIGKMSSFTGTGVKVSKPGNNTTDPSKASAYKTKKALKPGRNPMGEQIARESDSHKGSDLVKSDYKKRKDARRRNRQFSGFEGPVEVKSVVGQRKDFRKKNQELRRFKGVLVKSPYKQKKDARKKSEEISKYRGDLLVNKMPKGAHPSSAWRGGKVKNTYQQKEKYRKRMMKRIGRNKNKMQPGFLQKKNREEKPTYDSRESEIWLKPR
jgi:hypothetical protein